MTADAGAWSAAVLAAHPELDGPALAVFALLCVHAPLSGRQLAKRLNLAQSEAFRALALLADAGLVSADGAADALAGAYRLSAAGEALRRRIDGG